MKAFMFQKLLSPQEAPAPPRSVGSLILSTKSRGCQSRIDRLRTSGATKVAFPRRLDAVEAITLNTSGGLTGGDRFDTFASAGPGSRLVLTSQAAERAYRSLAGTARVATELEVATGATLHWLPQELIVFDGAAIERRLTVELDPNSSALIVEPVVFGRLAMGETSVSGTIRDRIMMTRAGKPLYCDRFDLSGPISARLDRPGIANGLTALATVLFCDPRAEALLPAITRLLPETGGASLVASDLVVVRLLAADSYMLRKSLVPVLETLSAQPLPKSWSL